MTSSAARVLVVSTEVESATLVCEILNERGYAAEMVTTDQVTLDHLRPDRTDLVVLDMFAPLLQEWPILDELLRIAEPPPLLALTARSVSPDALAALVFHTRAHLSKPFAPDALVHLCESLLASGAPPPRPTDDERRAETRFPFVGEAMLLTTNGDASVRLQVLDLSATGARIAIGPLLATRLVPGVSVRLALALPMSPTAPTIEAHIEWRRDGLMGISFAKGTLPAGLLEGLST
jgi:DNA-binding response OmpR family regulator